MIKHKKYDYFENHQMVYKIERQNSGHVSMGFDKGLKWLKRNVANKQYTEQRV